MPVAAGVALHLKRTEPGRIAVVYIGDGTWGEGSVYEALNLAALWELPLVVAVENNGIAQSTPTTLQMAGTIAGRAAAFGIDHVSIESMDVAAIRAQLMPMIVRCRAECRPLVAEFVTHRVGPHSKGDDTRASAELEWIGEHDWYRRYASAFHDQFDVLDGAERARVERIVREIDARAPSVWESAP
jgi:pyruvate dehydrogenase E1 component alpha subunit